MAVACVRTCVRTLCISVHLLCVHQKLTRVIHMHAHAHVVVVSVHTIMQYVYTSQEQNESKLNTTSAVSQSAGSRMYWIANHPQSQGKAFVTYIAVTITAQNMTVYLK